MLKTIFKTILMVSLLLPMTIRSCKKHAESQRKLEQAKMQLLDEEMQLLELIREVKKLTQEEKEWVTEKIRKNNILTQEEVQLRKLLKRVD